MHYVQNKLAMRSSTIIPEGAGPKPVHSLRSWIGPVALWRAKPLSFSASASDREELSLPRSLCREHARWLCTPYELAGTIPWGKQPARLPTSEWCPQQFNERLMNINPADMTLAPSIQG